ncbi:unnamed protein product [Meloidogyne enterolobii]|uniref:Uncharacterized protein n=1 Tax=Meloidogyne enterolobii TaxID=390850 RepID=A0ACB0Y5A2_MELEN
MGYGPPCRGPPCRDHLVATTLSQAILSQAHLVAGHFVASFPLVFLLRLAQTLLAMCHTSCHGYNDGKIRKLISVSF